MKLWNVLKRKMMENPTQKIGEGKACLTYEEVVIMAELLAPRLKGMKCYALCCNSEMATAMALLGCFAAGVTALPLSIRYGLTHCEHILDAISPDGFITDEDGRFCVQRICDSTYEEPEHHPALIMCTSGTTGKPKGAMLSEENILTNVIDITEYFAIDKSDTILIARPLYHCAVLTGEFLTSLMKGTRIVFYSGEFHPLKMLEMIKEEEITVFGGTPTLLGMMARLKHNTEIHTLKHICVSGECMDKEKGLAIAEAFPESWIYHVYGLTEAGPRVSFLPPDMFKEYPDCVGIPLRSVSVKIVKEDGSPARKGEEGLLWVKGKNVMLGYYQEPEKTAKVLKDGWLCTNDVAVMNGAGLLRIKGRKDDMIIKSGMNIYPVEIESALRKDTRVKEVMVYGIKGRYGTQIGMTVVGDFSSVTEVKRLCIECLPSYQVPTTIVIADELPKNGSGKRIRRDPNA